VELIAVILIIAVLIALLLPAVQSAREQARQTQSRNNLKQIGLALHNYHDTFGHFPPGGSIGANGAGQHGWLAMIIPFLDANPFSLMASWSRPWDDPEQLELFSSNLMCYRDPSISPETTKDGLFVTHFAANEWLFHANSAIHVRDIPDTKSTFFVANAAGHYQPWGYAWNWRDPTLPLGTDDWQFGRHGFEFTMVLFADGHVEPVNNSVAAARQQSWAGPDELRPNAAQIARPRTDYRPPPGKTWQTVTLAQHGEKWRDEVAMRARKDPAGNVVKIRIGVPFPMKGWEGPPPDAFKNDVALLLKHPSIEWLLVGDCLSMKELEVLRSLSKLRTLSLSGAATADDVVDLLLDLPQLEQLQFVSPVTSSAGFERLLTHPGLRLMWLEALGSDHLSPQAAQQLLRHTSPCKVVISTGHYVWSPDEIRKLVDLSLPFVHRRDLERRNDWPCDGLLPANIDWPFTDDTPFTHRWW